MTTDKVCHQKDHKKMHNLALPVVHPNFAEPANNQ
jgi:hypothetical protein